MDDHIPLRLSKHLVLESEDPNTGDKTIFNNMTGMRAQLSVPTMSLLKLFEKPRTILEVVDRLANLDVSAETSLHAHLEMLVSQTILLQGDGDDELRVSVALADSDLVSAQQQTFVGAPAAKITEVETGSIALCGVGVDFATTGKSGAKLGPAVLRRVSTGLLTYDRDIFTGNNQGWYNTDLGRTILTGARLQDVGNVSHKLSEPPHLFYERLNAVARSLCSDGALPVIIGGDHSLTAPVVEAVAETIDESVVVVQFDAHTDLAEWVPESTHHHGNVMRRMLHTCEKAELLQLGIRGFAGNLDDDVRRKTFSQASIDDDIETVLSNLPSGRRCYLTIDTDVLDPAFAPGTGTPVPMGMHPRQLLQIAERLVVQNQIVGLDIVELCPSEDRNDMTSSLMFHLLMNVLGLVHEHR
jgi:agmatinase